MNIHIGDTVEARVSRGGGWFLARITDIWCFELPWGVRFDVRAPDGLVGGAILPSDIRLPTQQARIEGRPKLTFEVRNQPQGKV